MPLQIYRSPSAGAFVSFLQPLLTTSALPVLFQSLTIWLVVSSSLCLCRRACQWDHGYRAGTVLAMDCYGTASTCFRWVFVSESFQSRSRRVWARPSRLPRKWCVVTGLRYNSAPVLWHQLSLHWHTPLRRHHYSICTCRPPCGCETGGGVSPGLHSTPQWQLCPTGTLGPPPSPCLPPPS